MTIRKSSFLWKFAFGYRQSVNQPVGRVLRCEIGFGALLGIIAWPTLASLMCVFICILLLVTILGFLFFGYRWDKSPINTTKSTKEDERGAGMVRIKSLPTIRGHRVLPISMLIAGWIIYSAIIQWNNLPAMLTFRLDDVIVPPQGPEFWTLLTVLASMYFSYLGTILFCIYKSSIYIGEAWQKKSDAREARKKYRKTHPETQELNFLRMIREYIRDKKEKICPYVDIIDDSPKNSQSPTTA